MKHITISIIILTMAIAQSAFTQVTFSSKTDFATGTSPRSISIGDINGDGMIDMAVANIGVDSVSVLLNTSPPGASTPTFSNKTDFLTGSSSCSVSMEDFNGDGMIDMAVTNSSANTVTVRLNATSPGASTPSFSVKKFFTTGTSPYSVSTGDFNGDGKVDMAVANYGSASVSVLLNTTSPGASTSSFSTKNDFTTGTSPYSVSTGDFNGDGLIDMAVVNNGSNTVSIFLNTTLLGDATPTFSAKTDFATGTSPNSISTGDFNGDGLIDMAVVNSSAKTVSVLLNTTSPGGLTPTFSAKTDFAAGSGACSVSLGDFNEDGKIDMAVANVSADSISVLINTTSPGASTPTFSAKADYATGSGPCFVSNADFNGDEKNDLVLVNNSTNTASVLLNTTTLGVAAPSFSAKTDFVTGGSPFSGSIRDFNSDGKYDMAVVNQSTDSVSVFLNTTVPGAVTPSFLNKKSFLTGDAPSSVSTGDFNGDGKNDMAVVNYSASSVSVLLNTTAPGAAIPAFSAKTDFISGTQPRAVSIGDFNGDGKNDMAVVNSPVTTVSVFINTTIPGGATPTFSTKKNFTTGSYPYAVSISDFNGDGKNDMAIVNYSAPSVSVLLNITIPGDTIPAFSAKADFTTGNNPQSVSIGDFNGDGKNDMAVANSASNTVSVFLNTTSPGAATASFSAKRDFTTGSYPYSVSIGDFNGDGKNDIVVTNGVSNTVSILLNITSPGATISAFSAKTDFTTGTTPVSVSIEDFNGDGKNDMAVVNSNSNNVSVFFNNAILTSIELTSYATQVPETFALAQNYPNPFNPTTTFHFALPVAGDVKLVVINILGQEVAEVVNKYLAVGTYDYSWNAKNLSSGVYFYKLTTNRFLSVHKMILMK